MAMVTRKTPKILVVRIVTGNSKQYQMQDKWKAKGKGLLRWKESDVIADLQQEL